MTIRKDALWHFAIDDELYVDVHQSELAEPRFLIYIGLPQGQHCTLTAEQVQKLGEGLRQVLTPPMLHVFPGLWLQLEVIDQVATVWLVLDKIHRHAVTTSQATALVYRLQDALAAISEYEKPAEPLSEQING